jgi:membrane fusion protein
MFRPEVLAHIGNRNYGTILLTRPISYTMMTILFITIAAGIIVFFSVFTFTRKIHIPGLLLPSGGLIRITAGQNGIVVDRKVRDAQVVEAGEPLFVVVNERFSDSSGSAERNILTLLKARRESFTDEQAQQRLQSSQRVGAMRLRANNLGTEMRRIDDQALLQQRRVALAEATLARYTDLATSSFVAPAQVHDKQADLLDQQQRLADLSRAKAATNRELALTQADLYDLQVQAERDQLASRRNIAEVEQELTESQARREVVVRAPQSGQVVAITAGLGQSVLGNQVIATVLPAGSELEAELYAPSDAVGFLKPGMDVLLRYRAYAYQKFGQARGIVREVSSSALPPDDLNMMGGKALSGSPSEPLYRVRVGLGRQTMTAYGTEHALRSGALLDASVILEERRLYEWILDPLYRITGRL